MKLEIVNIEFANL